MTTGRINPSLKIAAIALALGTTLTACGDADESRVLGLWSGEVEGCEIVADDGTELRISIMNSPSGEAELATVTTSLGHQDQEGDGPITCQDEGTEVDGYKESITFLVQQECEGVGTLSYGVEATAIGDVLEGTINYKGGECAFTLDRIAGE